MRGRGGFIGANVTPASAAVNSAASGVWTLREAEALKRAGTWPSAPTLPGVPTALSGASGNAQVSLTWTAPASNGGVSITDYSVQYSSNSGSTWTTFSRTASATASQTVTGLTNGTAYVFRVAAINAIGIGAYTAASSSVTPVSASVPGAPTSLTNGGASYCGGIILSWTAPSDGGSAITSYRIRYSENSYATFFSVSPSGGTTNRTINLSSLIPDGYRYLTIRLSAVNDIGEGPYVAIQINPADDIYRNCG